MCPAHFFSSFTSPPMGNLRHRGISGVWDHGGGVGVGEDVRRTPSSDSDTCYSSRQKEQFLDQRIWVTSWLSLHRGCFKFFKIWFIHLRKCLQCKDIVWMKEYNFLEEEKCKQKHYTNTVHIQRLCSNHRQ